MADEIDMACDREQRDRDLAIAAARSRSEVMDIPAVGVCYNCESSVPPGLRYCDKDCRDDWAARRSAEARRANSG